MSFKPLFVYGTLRQGHANSARLGLDGQCDVVNNVQLPGYVLFNLGWFPGIQPGEGTVTGDLFMVPEDRFPALDSYEGAPDLYRRETVTIGEHTGVQVYIYNGNQPPETIASGDWFNKETAA